MRRSAEKQASVCPYDEQQSSPQRYSKKKKKKKQGGAAKDWQLGRHRQQNKEVYRPARRDGCPTVPETTEARCGSPQ